MTGNGQGADIRGHTDLETDVIMTHAHPPRGGKQENRKRETDHDHASHDRGDHEETPKEETNSLHDDSDEETIKETEHLEKRNTPRNIRKTDIRRLPEG